MEKRNQRDPQADLALCNAAPAGPWIRSGYGFQVLTSDAEHSVYEIRPAQVGNVDRQRALADLLAIIPEALPYYVNRTLEAEEKLQAIMFALEELAACPDIAGKPFFMQKDGKVYQVPADRLEGVFQAMLEHTEKVLPATRAAMQAYYNIDGVRLKCDDLRTALRDCMEALKFYADPQSYGMHGGSSQRIVSDAGKQAKQVLARAKEVLG
jgi:hypothetical protein